jgi:flagellar hook-associated protein 2
MTSITSGGFNLDVDGIITKLMTVEKVPLTALQTKATALDSKISAYGTVKSQLSRLWDASSALSKASLWQSKAVTSSQPAAVGVAVLDASAASATSFSVEVQQLARAQSVSSTAVAAGSGFKAGTLSLQLGSWNTPDGGAAAFTAGSPAAVSVSVQEGDSLSTIATKINTAGAGVTATVLKDLSGERLLLRSTATGEATGFRVQAQSGGSGSGQDLGQLAFDDAAPGLGMAANPVQYGRNAHATINGVAVTSASNTLGDTVAGLSLTLSQVTSTPVEVGVSTDAAALTKAVQGFVDAYNGMNQMLNAATAYDATTKTAALLQGDSVTVGLQNALRSLAGSAVGDGALSRLSDLGISVKKGGAGDLEVDSAKLAKALQNPAAVQQFFAGGTEPDGIDGMAKRFADFTSRAIGADGTLATRTASLQTQKNDNSRQQDQVNDRLTLTEARLRKQYAALDANLSSLTALDTYVSQQIAQWNKSKN